MKHDLVARAFRAFFRSKETRGLNAQPSDSQSGLESIDGRQYVVLRNVGGALAVYRATGGNRLRRLPPEDWPRQLRAAS